MGKKKIVAKKTAGGGREIRVASDPSRFDSEKIAWQVQAFDLEGKWGWKKIGPKKWWTYVLPKLKNLETMTWAGIQDASGGRSRGNNSHFVKVSHLTRDAQKRLEVLKLDDLDELFSLRLEGTVRIYGIREGRILKMIWFDDKHGDNANAVYPISR